MAGKKVVASKVMMTGERRSSFDFFAFAFSFNSELNGLMENSTDDEKRRARAMRAGEEMEEEGRAGRREEGMGKVWLFSEKEGRER